MLIDFRELFPRYNIKPKGVLHVGANIGEEAPIYLELGIKRQIWIEADPEIYQKLKQNISNNHEASAFNYCAGDEEGKEVVFHISNNGSQSSSVLELGTHLLEHPDVHYVKEIPMKTRRLDILFYDGLLPTANLGEFDFFNCDTQGFDLNVIKGMGVLLHQFKWLNIESNKTEVYKKGALVGELEEYILKFP